MTTVNLDTDFFANPKIKQLAEQPDGHKRILVWIRLLCIAGKVDDEGRIYQHKGEVLNRNYLASILGITEEEVGEYLKTYKRLRMIRFDQDNTMRLTNWQKWQGKGLNGRRESEESGEKDIEKENSPLIPPYKERDTEKEGKEGQEKKEKRDTLKELSLSSVDRDKVIQVITYLNRVCNTHFKYSTPNTIRHIKARYNEGYNIQDFKAVIDSKYKEWRGTKYEKYLIPDTLFGSKFEGYLQYAQRQNLNSSFDEDEFIQAALNRDL